MPCSSMFHRLRTFFLALFFLPLLAPGTMHGQARPLITAPVDETKLAPLTGGLSARLKGASDLGAADVSQPSGRMFLMLKRSDEQEAALQSFLQQAHQQGSPQFHQWLTPSSFAQQYGAADADVQQVSGWLKSHGLKVAGLAVNKGIVEFSGTIGQVNEAFHTSIHQYKLQGETHVANATAAQIPAALSAAVAGISQLNDFHPKSAIKVLGRAAYDPKKHTGNPQWTYPEGTGNPPFYFLTPEDFATQYDVKPVYTAGVNGAGQTIGIINDSNIDISLVNAYRKLFGLSVNPPEIVIDGTDPGVNGDSIEAYLDVENAGAIAPAATVKLYIAGYQGELSDGGLDFALLRAVNDDAASVLSLSFGTCEEDGTSYNQFINSLWEQAAAQGQTVLVSTGDSGAFGCYGLGVNGFASTPWDIGVGGTDAYFTDYAKGGASISTFWSNTNDSTLGSLQTRMTEQPWNGTQFGLNSITYDPVADQPDNSGAGGGGSSACAVGGTTFDPNTGLPICISGYPKPSWQVGTGVPKDGVRDLPDVALFASNGYNGVTWPVCIEAGDCTETDPAANALFVNGVGGTSASTPAMAGIMALVNQKYGPQGQANFTLYALAAQYPAVFNDITVGSNNEPCPSYYVGFTFGCALDTKDSYYSLQNYYAGVGYDRASGLGSVDVNQLLTNWSKVAFKTSTTTLSLTPTTITHGQNVVASVAVTGSGTPAGSVALVSSTTLPNNKGIGSLQLGPAGTASETINYLPGGTYTIVGRYSGDGVNASSTSQPVTVTVNPEASTLVFTPQYLDPNTFLPTTITANAKVPYGSEVLMDVQIDGANGTQDGNPTGTVTFTDGTTPLGTFAVSAGGTAEFNASLLNVGTHTIGGTYSGDASYKASTFGPLTFTITQAVPYLFLFTDNAATYNPALNAEQYQVGQQGTIEGIVAPQITGGATPTGTITFQVGSAAPVVVTVVPGQDLLFLLGSTAATALSNAQAGTYNVTATYSGDANYGGLSATQEIVVVPDTLLNSTSTFTITSPTSLANLSPSTIITIQGTVTGLGANSSTAKTAPTGTVSFMLASFLSYQPITITPGTGASSTVSFQIRAADLEGGNNSLSMAYSGDSVYAPSTSGFVTLLNNNTDFTLQTTTPNLVIASGASGTGTLSLTPLNGFSGSVSITCAAAASLTCTPVATSVVVNGTTLTSTTVTINASVLQGSNAIHPGADWRRTGGGVVLACLFVWFLPRRRRLGAMLLSMVAMGVLLTAAGCSNSGTSQTSKNAVAGSYNVVVTGTSAAGTIHNTNITVIVQ